MTIFVDILAKNANNFRNYYEYMEYINKSMVTRINGKLTAI